VAKMHEGVTLQLSECDSFIALHNTPSRALHFANAKRKMKDLSRLVELLIIYKSYKIIMFRLDDRFCQLSLRPWLFLLLLEES